MTRRPKTDWTNRIILVAMATLGLAAMFGAASAAAAQPPIEPASSAAPSTAASSTAAPSERPNVIWLMAEDMGLDLECYGMPGVKTPNLNQMASEGALYTHAYCSNPICSPNRSAMMVGVDQTRINAHHHRSNRDVPLLAPYKPITYFLRDAGYTCLLGHDMVMHRGRKTDCNFKHTPTGPYDGVENFGLFDKAANFTAADQPFFSQIQLAVTHRGDWWNEVRSQSKHPVSVDDVVLPPWFADTPEIRYDWAAYLDTVEYMDDEVGQLMQSLRDQGLDKNTVVIFIADNGRCNLRGKGYLHESGIHVPMIVWAPGIVDAGTIIEDMVCTTDISASILHLAGVKTPDYMTATPLIGVEEPQYATSIRSARDIWDEIDECSRSVTTKDFKYIRNLMPEVPWATDQAYLELNRPALHVMRRLKAEGKLKGDEMTFFADFKPAEELYDLNSDPDELNNLAADPKYAEALGYLRTLEANWQSEFKDFGLDDLGNRTPEENMASVVTRAAVKAKAPELWQELESGKLMETQAWSKKYDDKPKNGKRGKGKEGKRKEGKAKAAASGEKSAGVATPVADAPDVLHPLIDPSQQAWYKKYRTQENAPQPDAMLLNTQPEPDLSGEMTSMFNGTDLTGWTPFGGECKFDVRDDGIVVGTCVQGSNSTYLCTDRDDYGDFLFTCDMKWEVDGNSGVMFRSKIRSDQKEEKEVHTVFGPQAEMEGIKQERYWNGAIYGQSCGGYFYPLWLKSHADARAALKRNTTDWNRLTILAKGNSIKTWVNGVPAANWNDDGTYAQGRFGLQVHKGKAGTILFRNVRIAE